MTFNPIERIRTVVPHLPFQVLLSLLSLLTSIAVFLPFSPTVPAAGLDQSWFLATNQAVALGLSFGGEFIFTSGPYGSVYTQQYHPATNAMMLGASLYLALSFWICLVLAMKGVRWRWLLIFCAVLVALRYSRDAPLLLMPLLTGLATFRIMFTDDVKLARFTFAPLFVAALFAPFGLLPLVKGSTLILCGMTAVICATMFLVQSRGILAGLALFTPAISMFGFWIAAGQSPATLPRYIISMTRLASGYADAMAIDGGSAEIALFLIACIPVFISILINTTISTTPKVFLSCTFFVFLFISFKAGFVRHDSHALIAGVAILFAALLLPSIPDAPILVPTITVAFLSWAYIDSRYIGTSPHTLGMNITSLYSSAWSGIHGRIANKQWPRSEFDAAVAALKKEAAFPSLRGTADIYSFAQSYLIASGNPWSPRPVFQSYAAYSPALAEANREHLLGVRAPDNVIFRVEPIDRRLPSIEDGISWPVLMSHYQPTTLASDFLFLAKRGATNTTAEPMEPQRSVHKFGEIVPVPESREPVFAAIEIRPTILGRAASFVFKSSQLQITLELKDGAKRQYRLIAGMAESGFVISPLVESTTEFAMLFGKREYLRSKVVKSIVIEPSGVHYLWKDQYAVVFSRLETAPPIEVSSIAGIEKVQDRWQDANAVTVDSPSSESTVVTAEHCDGYIDSLNGVFPAPASFSASGLLQVGGWLALSVDTAVLPEAVYVVLTDVSGRQRFIRTHVFPRPDVGTYFKKAELNRSGYTTTADISALEGQYTLGVAVRQSDRLMICPQIKIIATISK